VDFEANYRFKSHGVDAIINARASQAPIPVTACK
jgi:hypothetical protein